MDLGKILQEIQYMVAPAIMVSSAALLLLGFQNKFSTLANRFRALNQERRFLSLKNSKTKEEAERLANLSEQVHHLHERATCVKNAILLVYAAIACFVSTSICVFISVHTVFQLFYAVILLFLLGFILILISSFIMIKEILLAFKIVTLEKKSS